MTDKWAVTNHDILKDPQSMMEKETLAVHGN